MKETPIIFSAPSVQLILAGRKTQTRRVAKSEIHPYGDRLWVREAFNYSPNTGLLLYRADYQAQARVQWPWKAAIHMPKDACRLCLDVLYIHAERLNSITLADAIAEGESSVEQYSEVWNLLNSKRGYPWSMNPMVWRIVFKVVAPVFRLKDAINIWEIGSHEMP